MDFILPIAPFGSPIELERTSRSALTITRHQPGRTATTFSTPTKLVGLQRPMCSSARSCATCASCS
jgi:hypothetical protein